MSGPHVSVVIPAYHSHSTIRACLTALREQTFQDFEVIVVDSTPDDRTATIVREDFPNVVIHHHRRRLLPHEARNHGARIASGHILVFSDPDCVASPDWLEYLVAAHSSGNEAVGGSVACEPGWWNLAVHLSKYPWWLPSCRPQPRPEVPSANSSFSRELWEQVGPYRAEYFAGDSELSWRIRSSNKKIWFEPRATVTHVHPLNLMDFLKERYRRGQDFACMRIHTQEWSRWRCLSYLLLFPFLPALMTGRAARYAIAGRHVWKWLVTLPGQFAGAAAWCAGEVTSHWSGLCRH